VLALCRRTRQVVAYWLGDRSETSAVHVWEQLPTTTPVVIRSATNGRLIGMSLTTSGIDWSTRMKVKPTPSNAGSIPYGNGWGALPVKL
jgi:hypothetical protein